MMELMVYGLEHKLQSFLSEVNEDTCSPFY